jgi:hypothetical protein
MPALNRLFALLGIASGLGGLGIFGVWSFLRCQWTAPTPAPPATRAAASPTHIEVLPITTDDEVADLEKRLKEIGFDVCCFKCGEHFSGYSLGGRYERVDFRIMITHWARGLEKRSTVSVYLNADGPSLKEAERASRRLLAKLEKKNGEQNIPLHQKLICEKSLTIRARF